MESDGLKANKAPKLAAATFLVCVLQTKDQVALVSHLLPPPAVPFGPMKLNTYIVYCTLRGSEAASELRHVSVHLKHGTSKYIYFCLYTPNSNVHLDSIRQPIPTNLFNLPIKHTTSMCHHLHVVSKI